MTAPFPWKQVMAFGFGFLHLSPNEFWSLSLLELHAALEHVNPKASQAVDRSWLHKIMSEYPDINIHERHEHG